MTASQNQFKAQARLRQFSRCLAPAVHKEEKCREANEKQRASGHPDFV